MQRLLTAVLAACVVACVRGDVSHTPPSQSASPPPGNYPQTAPAPGPAPSTNAATPAHSYPDPQQGAVYEDYVYYYPVQQDKKKGGMFDFKKDSDLVSFIIVGVLLVGGLLVVLAYMQPEDARTLQVSYHDMYHLASQVYQAISKTY
ncbi:uncharacterized protein LOC123508898 [Portunus trituberculatus]|uniref:Uncharacterized protein n=1 Tax=Portunus trituberculatus TaxID=210409 RepID=A0A5B7CF84_PORTR|nr:uncharacterized protein LOC123508898 [Portunus trituberculatus]XP_045118842.1 uncharacterized protein LOC123508898 [Portunus trituberculatus]MPC08077.1 hypothetical protein [Portunus trituberculatus]